jgi:hypothetical protein
MDKGQSKGGMERQGFKGKAKETATRDEPSAVPELAGNCQCVARSYVLARYGFRVDP